MAEQPKQDVRDQLTHKLYTIILENDPNKTDGTKRVPNPPTYGGEENKAYFWNTEYIVSGIIKTGNVANIVDEFFKHFKDGKTIANAIKVRRNPNELEVVLYSIFTTLNYSLTPDNWEEAQVTVKRIAEASTKYRGPALTTVIKRIADMAFFLFSPEEMNIITNGLNNDLTAQELNEDGGRSLGSYLKNLEDINYEKTKKTVGWPFNGHKQKKTSK